MPVQGGNILARNITVFQKRFLNEVNKDMAQVQFLLDQKVTENISLTDHTPEDLAALGHPYSAVHPGAPLHSPEFQVHKQSGKLLGGKYSGTKPASVSGAGDLTASAFVGISEAIQYAIYLIYGTRKMIPRDFLRGSLAQVKDEAKEILSRSLRNVVVSFDGEKIKL